jgi:uncharacterized protein (DUF1330 family)
MATDLINHLRIRGVPRPGGLEYLEQVEATFELYGGEWLMLGADDEVRDGAWPGWARRATRSETRKDRSHTRGDLDG